MKDAALRFAVLYGFVSTAAVVMLLAWVIGVNEGRLEVAEDRIEYLMERQPRNGE